jgi:hypothetical protein
MDRALLYESLQSEGVGEAVGFRDSFVIFNHSAVSAILKSEDQPRGQYLGAAEVPERCMSGDTLIFQGTGPSTWHSQVRKFFMDNVPAFKSSDPNGPNLAVDLGTDAAALSSRAELSPTDLDDIVMRTLIRTLFKTIFEAPIDEATLEAFIEYTKWGGTCVLGADFHQLTGNLILIKIKGIRARMTEGVLKTPVGQRLQAAAADAASKGLLPNNTEEEMSGRAIVRQLTDGAAFAGILGTSHLTLHALHRIQSHPRHYSALFDEDPVAFLHEEARVDPPVTSVTGVLGVDTTVTLSHAGQVLFPKGSPYQIAISTANTDPDVFGGEFHSAGYAHSFDPKRDNSQSLSWNGVLEDVAVFSAPRGCPGYKLSMLLAKSIVAEFKPNASTLPRPEALVGAGKAHGKPLSRDVEKETAVMQSDPHSTPESPGLLDKFGYAVSMAACYAYVGWLYAKKDGEMGPVTFPVSFYLLAQAGVALGFFMESELGDIVYLVSKVAAAAMYMFVFATVACQKRRFDGSFDGSLLTRLISLSWFIVGCGVAAVRFFFGPLPTLKPFVAAYYCAGGVLGAYAMYRSLIKSRGTSRDHLRENVKRGIWGSVGAVVSQIVRWFVPYFGVAFSHFIMAFVTLPLVIPATLEMDKLFSVKIKAQKLPNGHRLLKRMGVVALCSVVLVSSLIIFVKDQTRNICGFESTRPIPDDLNLCKGTELSSVDIYGRILYQVVVSQVNKAPDEIAAVEDSRSVKLPIHEKKLPMMEAVRDLVNIPTEDEDLGESSWLELIKKQAFINTVQNPMIFPITDTPKMWSNVEKATAAMNAMGGHLLPEPVGDWDGVDVTSDATIAQMCFAGMAGSRVTTMLEKDEFGSRFKVDFSELAALPVREGFERFGATAFFNAKQEVTRIRWKSVDVVPGHPHWEHAKWVFRCSALLGITATEHLMESHLVFANIASTASREALPSHHPMRRLIKPFTHLTPSVNMGAQEMLTQEYSLLHRAAALTFDGLLAAFKGAYIGSKLAVTPMASARAVAEIGLKENQDFDFPYATDGTDLKNVIGKFVTGYIDVYYPDEASFCADKDLRQFWNGVRMVKGESTSLPPWSQVTKAHMAAMATSAIFHVTGIHHVVGNVAEYLVKPNFSSPRIRGGSEVADVESSFYGMLVAILTGMKAPKLMDDFSHILLDDAHHDETSKLMEEFQADLALLAVKIDERNANRKWKFYGFHPRRLLSSISI